MIVTHVDGLTRNIRGTYNATQADGRAGLNHPTTAENRKVVPTPKKGNTGIVPPWLQHGNGGIVPPWLQDQFRILPWPFPILPEDPVAGVDLIGIAPVDPDIPHIM